MDQTLKSYAKKAKYNDVTWIYQIPWQTCRSWENDHRYHWISFPFQAGDAESETISTCETDTTFHKVRTLYLKGLTKALVCCHWVNILGTQTWCMNMSGSQSTVTYGQFKPSDACLIHNKCFESWSDNTSETSKNFCRSNLSI